MAQPGSLKQEYLENGFCLLPGLFPAEELSCIDAEIEGSGSFHPGATVRESDGHVVRSIYGGHESSPVMQRLIADDRLLSPAMQLLDSPVYLYQFKVNMKHAFAGDIWPWHQDYAFWSHLDGMPRPDAITVALFLDDVTEFNAPMFCVPGSHRSGLYPPQQLSDDTRVRGSCDHELEVSSRLRFTLGPDTIQALVGTGGLFSARAPRGSLLFFHPNLVHASSVNISPHSRRQLLVTYNSIHNVLPQRSNRATYLVNAAMEPLIARQGPLSKGARTLSGAVDSTLNRPGDCT